MAQAVNQLLEFAVEVTQFLRLDVPVRRWQFAHRLVLRRRLRQRQRRRFLPMLRAVEQMGSPALDPALEIAVAAMAGYVKAIIYLVSSNRCSAAPRLLIVEQDVNPTLATVEAIMERLLAPSRPAQSGHRARHV